MKSITLVPTEFVGGLTVPLPGPITTGARPVRRGNFWPGENFTANTSKWDLTGAFTGAAFVLPALSGGKGSRTL